ncbi:unnamed protein product [Rotaria magnacalcarata]|uniref:F-box domain-containing protein n=1 Tax=Rotaria magnacalcarata TaxID=392030 RepID=A0A819Q6E5_9BILA|nr:unnamed protein product [Rotaria magnacalcarata]CAF2183246.1 unnamed protein product [Rotaria magnacalcarata]CAF3967482.1 unnamed protein product [Rotaria magnacalcarata]CAF4029966.1 unnamed protein product [Rotaria magnacalcarata]
MKLEVLANELILDLFEYLTTAELLQAFHSLNSRFKSLIIHHFQMHTFEIGSLAINNFQKICEHYLPSMINKINRIHLIDHIDTRTQLTQLYTYNFALHQFVQLTSLTLFYLDDYILNEITVVLPHLSNLTHLSFEYCNLTIRKENMLILIDTIWSLPNLSHCNINHAFRHHESVSCPIGPTVVSSSLRHVYISHENDACCRLTDIFQHTPRLESLYALNSCLLYTLELPSSIQMITRLKLLECEYSRIVCLLPKMINLCELIFTTADQTMQYNMIENELEKIIRKSLTKLERLEFTIAFLLDEQKQIDNLFNSFQRSFWTDKRKQFIQYDWYEDESLIFFYTLPYAFNTFHVDSAAFSQSTCPQTDKQWFCDRVHSLTYDLNGSSSTPLTNLIFSKVETLTVAFPVSGHFWSMIPRFDRLTLLEVVSYRHCTEHRSQLLELLQRASHLSFYKESHADGKLIYR